MEDFDDLPKMAGWHEANLAVPKGSYLTFGNLKPNYNITFHRTNASGFNVGEPIGALDFNLSLIHI